MLILFIFVKNEVVCVEMSWFCVVLIFIFFVILIVFWKLINLNYFKNDGSDNNFII